MPKTSPTVTVAEWRLIFWQRGTAGSFNTALFNAATCADTINLARLERAFPELIGVYRRYANEPGYWEALQRRANEFYNKPADDLGNLIEGE